MLFLVVITLDCFAQKTLQVLFTRFGTLKKFEIYNGDILEYKFKGEHKYRQNKITNLQDSFIVFSNDTIIKLDQLKAIRIRKNNFVVSLFQGVFITGGATFFFLNTTNNLINERSPIVDQNAALIGASLITTGFLIKQIGIRRIRITKHKQLKVIELNFNNLSNKSEK
ncbi:MAG: hypothetical protein Q8T03_03510 [Bacteroidota bacterium]|nr:hypothetical protein [Bacteroidota bacterium]